MGAKFRNTGTWAAGGEIEDIPNAHGPRLDRAFRSRHDATLSRALSAIRSSTTSTIILGCSRIPVTQSGQCAQRRHQLRYEFEPTGQPDLSKGQGAPGNGQVYVDGKLVGHGEIAMTVPILFGVEGLSCGYEFGEAVTHDYHAPFRFTGTTRVRAQSGQPGRCGPPGVEVLLHQSWRVHGPGPW